MSEADTDSTDEKLTDESTSITQTEPSIENSSILMDTIGASKDVPSSSQEQPKEVSQTSSSSSDTSVLNIAAAAKDPEKDIKDESNKTTDSPKRVKLIRPEFDKEKLAQKIREIEEREKLKQLNKLKEQELSKSEEKSGDGSSENKSDEAELQDTEKSEDSKSVAGFDKIDKNEEKSTSKTLESDESSKVGEKSSKDVVPKQDTRQDNVVSAVDSGKNLNEGSKLSTSVEDSKNVDNIFKSDSKTTLGTSAHVPVKQKQGGNAIEKDDVKAKDTGKEKIVESETEVSSTVEESIIEKEAKVGGEATKKEVLERKKVVTEKGTSAPKQQVGTNEAETNFEETSRSQIQVEIKPANASSSTETATMNKDVIFSTHKQNVVGSIEKKDIKDKGASDVCKRVQNTGGEKVASKNIDSAKPVIHSLKAVDVEKKNEDSVVTSGEKKNELDTVTIGKIGKSVEENENIVKDQQSLESDGKRKVESSVIENVGDLDEKLKDGNSGAEVIESKSKVHENMEGKIEKSVSFVTEEENSVPIKEKQVKMAEKMKSVESASSVNVQQSIESVLDELTVEPSKYITKSLGKVGLDTTSKNQESASSKQKHIDECSNKSDDILLEIEKFIDSSSESTEKLEANQIIVAERLTGESKYFSSGENSAPTSSKRKLDDEISNEDAKRKYLPTNIDSIKTKESVDEDNYLGSNDKKHIAGKEKLVPEEEKKSSSVESMEISESYSKAADHENKEETDVSIGGKSGDDKSSQDLKDDDGKIKESPPLETILDSIIDFEPEPSEIPEEDLVISDIPSTALVESKIPESPRRVKLVRPSKPATKTLTKPEATQKISQTKPVEQKLAPETKLKKDVSVKPSTKKSQDVQEEKETKKLDKESAKKLDEEETEKADKEDAKEPEKEDTKKLQKEDSKKLDEEETIAVIVPQPSDKPVELEKKLSVPNEPPTGEKIDSSKEMKVESSITVNPATQKAVASKLPIVEKLTTEKPIPSKSPIFLKPSSMEPELKLEETPVVESQETRKSAESVEKTLPNQPLQKVISTKEPSKDISSGKLPLEEPVSQLEEKIAEPSVDLTSTISVEKSSVLKSTESVPTSTIAKEKKSDSETIEKHISEKPATTSNLATSEELTPSEITSTQEYQSRDEASEDASKEPVVTKEPTEKLTEVSKIPEISAPEKIDAAKSTPEKSSPTTPMESETAKLRRIIRKPRVERSIPNESKQAETVTLTTVVHGVEKKQEISSTSKQGSEGNTEVKKATQESVALDMTVDEEEDKSSIVTSSETRQEAETKQLGFKLKIAKSSTSVIPKEDKSAPQSSASILAEKLMSQKSTEHTFGSITISATTSKHQTDMKKVEEMLKDTDVTITPLVDRETVQKLSKITLKIGKDGNPPKIKQTGEGRSSDIKRKQVEKVGDDGGSPSRKKMKDESAVLTTSSGVEIDLHMKKPKLLSSLIAEPPMTSQDPRMMMAQQMMAQTSQQMMGLSAQQQAMVQQMISQQMMGGQQMMGQTPQQMMSQTPQQTMQQMMSQLTPQQTNIFLGTPQSSGMFPGSPGTPGSGVVKKKRGRPRKIPLPEGQLPQDQQIQALKQQMMMQSQQGSSGTGTSSGSGGSDEYSSGVFPQVPLFDMTESLFDQSHHLFPNQVNPMQGRPQRSCRGRIKLPSVRSRKPRGSTMAVRAAGTGRGRGRGYKRVQEYTESDNIITLENVKEEMRRQSMEQAQFLASKEPMQAMQMPSQTPDEPTTSAPPIPTDPVAAATVQGLMKSPERKPRKRRTEEQERERIAKMKQRREEKKMKTLEKKRKIAEAKAKEKAAVMAAALVEEETRMSAPERREEAEKKKDVKTEEKKVEGETDVSLVEEPSQPDSIRIVEPEEVSQQSLDTKGPVQFKKELIEAEESQEPSTPISKPDLVDVTSNSCDESVKEEPSSFQDIKKESSSNTDTVEPSFVTPRKEKKIYRCLICREESALKKLTSPLDHRSWRVLYQAAIVRGHEEIINLTKNLSDEIPTGILYHRNCRSEFTHKKTLAKLTDCPLPEDNQHHHHQPAAVKTTGAENINPNTPKEVRMEGTITEYQWPLQGGELYMIQEQVSDFLEITSFKRKYPDIFRRTVEPEEKAYLRENGLVSEAHCDLGLIAVKSSDVLDIMFADFQDKYEEFRKQIRDKQARELSSKHKAAFTSLLLDKRRFENRVLDAKTEAMQAVAAWNSRLNRTRTEQRRCMLDLQSMIVHYPKTVGVKRSQVPNPPGKVGHYPVALVPGQFCDHYKRYNPNELKYFPLNTVIYGPMKPNERFGGGSDGSLSDSDSSSSSDDSSDSSSESSQDGSVASGDESNDKDVKERQPSGETHCKLCGGDKTRNKQDNPEVLINCAQCTKSSQLLQLNRLPTVLLSNCSIRSPIKAQSSLSKLLKPVGAPSPVKRLKTENGSIGTDSPKPSIVGVLGQTENDSAATASTIDSPKPSIVRVLGKTENFSIGTANPTDSPKPSIMRVLGKTENGSIGTANPTDSPKPSIVRVLGTQLVKVQGGTQFVRTQEIPSMKVQEAQRIRVLGTQIVKSQEVPNMKVQGTQEAQSIKVMGTPIVQTQEVPSMNVMGTQIVKAQETQGVQAIQRVEVEPKIVGTQDAPSIKVQESQNVGTQDAKSVQETQKVEIQETENVDTQGSQRVQGQEIQDVEIQETQSMKVEESRNVEVLESLSVEVGDSQDLKIQETQNVKAQKIPSCRDKESRSDDVSEAQSIKIKDSKMVEVQDSQSIEVQEQQNVEIQEPWGIEVEVSQNVDIQEAQYARPLPEQVISSDSNTSNSTNSTLQSNTVSSDSNVDSVDKADTVSSTVEPV